MCPPGWGELPNSHTKSESSWGEPAPSPVTVDNGTSAWGKPTGSCGGWGDSNQDTYSRGNTTMTSASCKPGRKLGLYCFQFSIYFLKCVYIWEYNMIILHCFKKKKRFPPDKSNQGHQYGTGEPMMQESFHRNLHCPLVAMYCFSYCGLYFIVHIRNKINNIPSTLFFSSQTYARWMGRWKWGAEFVRGAVGGWGGRHVEQCCLPGEQLLL